MAQSGSSPVLSSDTGFGRVKFQMVVFHPQPLSGGTGRDRLVCAEKCILNSLAKPAQ